MAAGLVALPLHLVGLPLLDDGPQAGLFRRQRLQNDGRFSPRTGCATAKHRCGKSDYDPATHGRPQIPLVRQYHGPVSWKE